MSEAENVAQITPREQILQADAARLEAEYAEAEGATPADESDTDGTPESSTESEAGILADTDNDEQAEDTDGTPEAGESDEGEWEPRYKELQATYTQVSQELSDIKAEQAESIGQITQAQFDLQDKFDEVQKQAEFFQGLATQELNQLRGMNVNQLSQEQYQQWQQAVNQAQYRSDQFTQMLNDATGKAKQEREQALKREVAISRARLEKTIPDFEETYPKIGEYAKSQGVNPAVFSRITDPALIEMLYKGMEAANAPDKVTVIDKQTTAKRRATKNLRDRDEQGRFKKMEADIRSAKSQKERQALILQRDAARYAKEYG